MIIFLSIKRGFYDESYYERMHRWSLSDKYKDELHKIAELLEVGQNDLILDIGCSTGNAVRYFSEKFNCKIVGMDFSQDWLRIVKIPNVVRADAHFLPFRDSSFDKIYMCHVIGHLVFPEKAINEVRRVLKPSGRFVIITPNKNFVYLMKPLNCLRIIRHTPDPTVLRYHTIHTLRRSLKNAGLEVRDIFTYGELPNLARAFHRFSFSDRLRERIFCLCVK